MAEKRDAYANVALATVNMSAANTLTFSQVQMAVGMFQGVAMVIHRVLWFPYSATLRELVAATDSLLMAICTSNRLTTIADVTDPTILASKRLICVAANTEPFELPLVNDFSNYPGGGKIVAANPLYVAAFTGGFAAAGIVAAQLDFSFVSLTDKDYLEVLQSQFPANV